MPASLSLDEQRPVVEADDSRFEAAAGLLEKAAQATASDPNVAYMLAMAHKRQGNHAEARAALRKIAKPDANILLQMGLLSLRENNPAQAEQDFERSLQMDPKSYGACYNLLLTRLTLNKRDACQQILPRAQELAPTKAEKDFLAILKELLRHVREARPSEERDLLVLGLDSPLEAMSQAQEQRLIELSRSLGQIDVVFTMLRTLGAARPRSQAVLEAFYEAALAKARDLMSRGNWTEALWLLGPLAQERAGTRTQQAALCCQLGCCCYLTQEFDKAASYFHLALKLSGSDPRIIQNVALSYEQADDMNEAEEYWGKFLNLLDSIMLSVPPGIPNYRESLEYETLVHVANVFHGKERWSLAVNYLNRALKIRPDDGDLMERMFHTYVNAKQQNQARKMLDRLRDVRPKDPQLDLYELDLIEVKNLNDIEKLLEDIDRVLRRHPDDKRVEERAVSMVGNVVPLMGNLCDQLTEQLNKVLNQVGNLPRYQIDWSALKEIMRDLIKEFQKLRRITNKCLPLVTHDDHKRIVRDLAEHIDKKIDACRSMT